MDPIDLFISLAHKVNTMSLNRKLDDAEFYFKEYENWWNWWVSTCADKYSTYIQSMLNVKDVPVYFVRHVDLKLNPKQELVNVFKFILERKCLNDTNIYKRIKLNKTNPTVE